MKRRYSKVERMAGLFVLSSIGLALFSFFVLAIKHGLFESRSQYTLYLNEASDLREGTPVEMAGLVVGKVSDIELASDRRVRVKLSVRRSYASQLPEATKARITRPFVLGEKVVELVPGLIPSPPMASGSELAVIESPDPLDILRGKSLGESVERISSILKNIESISSQANQKGQIADTLSNVAVLSRELKKIMPFYTNHAEQMGGDLADITKNVAALTSQINDLMPTVREMAKTAPESSRLLSEALHETNILVKAVQKTFLIRGRVEEVKEEESAKRLPANESK